ncbi:Bin3-domain-containing protein [Delitschia confertaspora ATCC 74209]|uniref:RNA methyltransferase n=1 Tax=Delitschia confertaspora ATCC 74209 TaxID=1513339 RepID=A0A9P4JQ49_9PLEO|nr:Bin3-domain-containing protein [Delitschia confertaspora ATCC 74209]
MPKNHSPQKLPERRSAPVSRTEDELTTGGTVWGNYKGYQGAARHFPGSKPSSHVQDRRLTVLESLVPGLFRGKKCLDIGCNDGAIPIQLAIDFEADSVTGVDIDPDLIKVAEIQFKQRASRVRPATEDSPRIVDYYPISVIQEHGYRDRSSLENSSLAPNPQILSVASHSPRVRFISADWLKSSGPDTSGPYYVILAMSIVKWIHLEHRDEGLLEFFKKCSASLEQGGYLVLEIQPWKSYEKAVQPRKAPHFKENLNGLKYRPETSFSELLSLQGLKLCATSEALPRQINVYRKE